jgi:hypothetical protein
MSDFLFISFNVIKTFSEFNKVKIQITFLTIKLYLLKYVQIIQHTLQLYLMFYKA